MRYVLAPMLICALGAPAALAMPSARPADATAAAPAIAQVARKKPAPARAPKRGRARKNSGGIHPLVGSGDY